MYKSRRKKEMIWIAIVATLYLLYNLPGVPKYNDSRGTMIHSLLTIIPLWLAVYIGQFIMNREYPLKKKTKDKK